MKVNVSWRCAAAMCTGGNISSVCAEASGRETEEPRLAKSNEVRGLDFNQPSVIMNIQLVRVLV